MAFGFAFQLPLGIFFLVKLGVVTPEALVNKEARYCGGVHHRGRVYSAGSGFPDTDGPAPDRAL